MSQVYEKLVDPNPRNKDDRFKGVTIRYRPTAFVARNGRNGLVMLPGESNVHYGESWFWCVRQRIKNRLFLEARAHYNWWVCRAYIRLFHTKRRKLWRSKSGISRSS